MAHEYFHNFITPHGTLTKASGDAGERIKTTPAMAAGLTDHPWTMEELLIEMAKSTLGSPTTCAAASRCRESHCRRRTTAAPKAHSYGPTSPTCDKISPWFNP